MKETGKGEQNSMNAKKISALLLAAAMMIHVRHRHRYMRQRTAQEETASTGCRGKGTENNISFFIW